MLLGFAGLCFWKNFLSKYKADHHSTHCLIRRLAEKGNSCCSTSGKRVGGWHGEGGGGVDGCETVSK